jgi:hypothetical protein
MTTSTLIGCWCWMTRQRIIQRRANTESAKRRRRMFAMSGDELVLAFAKAKKNPTTKQINQHWKSRGRAYIGERGSQYSIA